MTNNEKERKIKKLARHLADVFNEERPDCDEKQFLEIESRKIFLNIEKLFMNKLEKCCQKFLDDGQSIYVFKESIIEAMKKDSL